ncbi:hypothetical protein BD410DRAFT_262955 [Rickenella mellea]|uniref:Uncharacterized protein n=1 Tax=Rickenella mellea TaxID=50990 RepID=A0A4Y7Q484_9AGAM|nr:hypothetical protein BD410DRAFT_262955 [Rickenella mellea]
MATLNNVRDRLGRRIELLREACIPMVLEDGIKTLLNEILSHIFEHGHDMTRAGRLRNVYRKFPIAFVEHLFRPLYFGQEFRHLTMMINCRYFCHAPGRRTLKYPHGILPNLITALCPYSRPF